MVGMQSTTVNRLEHLGLWGSALSNESTFCASMYFGNRVYIYCPDGTFEQTSLNNSIAGSGWSWGCATADLDNDGYPDAYVANGFETRKSVRDYEIEFWLHDIYFGNTYDENLAELYFETQSRFLRG